MAYPSHSELHRYERVLRRDDPRMRLRFSQEGPNILLERQTLRGRIGALNTLRQAHTPDGGRRREEGHVLVASVYTGLFNLATVRDELKEADTWRRWNRNARPRHLELEEAESRRKTERDVRRLMVAEHHASNLWDRYVWKHKQRVAVA